MKIPSVKNSFQAAVSRGKEALPEIPKVKVAEIADRFSPPSMAQVAARRLGGLPAITLPPAQNVKDVFGDVREAGGEAVSGARERMSSLFGGLGDLLGGAKDRIEDFVGGLGPQFQEFKDRAITIALDEAFKLLEALPGEIDQRGLNRFMELCGVKAPERALTAEELEILKPIFGDGLDYDAIRVRVGEIGIFNVDDRPLVIGNSMLFPEGRLRNGEIRRDDLVHEALHNWQFQRGGIEYMKQSAQDQLTGGPSAYDVSDAINNRTPWNELRTEQQAVIIETAFEKGYFDGDNARVIIAGVDHTAYFDECITAMRSGLGAPGGEGANHG